MRTLRLITILAVTSLSSWATAGCPGGGVTKPGTGAVLNGSSLATGIKAAYLMNEGSGTSLTDLFLGSSASSTVRGWTTDTNCGGGITFNGSQYTQILNSSGLSGSQGAFSLMVIFKTASSSGSPDFFGASVTPVTNGTFWGLGNGNGKIEGYLNFGLHQGTSTSNADGNAHILVVSGDMAGNNVVGYLDGTSDQTGGNDGMNNVALNQTNWFLGARNATPDAPLNGSIYTVVVWNRALSSGDVTSLQANPWSWASAPAAQVGVKIHSVANQSFTDGPTAFGNLPTCVSGLEGTIIGVTDSNTATWGATVAAGGSNHISARCNGTNWTVWAK